MNLLLVFGVVLFEASTASKLEIVYERNLLDFAWPSEAARASAIRDGTYIPKNNALAGIKVWRDWIFLTVPRWKKGVPATLNFIKRTTNNSQLLQPFPTWQMQKIGDCDALQFVKEIEIDRRGRMCVLDCGRLIPFAGGEAQGKICTPRILAIDLNAYFFGPLPQVRIVRKYNFPKSVADPNGSFLSDLVIDEPTNFIYISDIGPDYGVIVYNYKTQTSFKLRDPSMKGDPNFPSLHINGVEITFKGFNADGIALSPVSKNRTLFYYPLSGRDLFSVPTSALKKNANISSLVTKIAKKTSVSEGMTVDDRNNLYFSLDEINTLAYWNIRDKEFSPTVIERNDVVLDWVDPLVIDDTGHLYGVSNRIEYFDLDKVNPKEINYRVFRTYIGAKSYLHPANNDHFLPGKF